MLWGKCRTCDAKDKEIEHLLALLDRSSANLEKAQARLSEIVDPGLTQRLVPRLPPAPRTQPLRDNAPQFPGYEPMKPTGSLEIEA